MNDYIPYHWRDCTFWRNPETGNFEVYGFPLTDYTLRLWKLQELGVWCLDAECPGADVFSISAHKLYRDWTFLELAALASICVKGEFDLSILHAAGHPTTKLIRAHAIFLSKIPPAWLDSVEPKNSSAKI